MERNQRYAESLARMIRVNTVSTYDDEPGKFYAFHELMESMFPHLFSVSEKEYIDDCLLMRWPGKTRKDPIMLMSHHDVVEAEGAWKYPPFDGVIAEGKLWGRGTLDTKGSLWAILQAAEELAAEGFVPSRDVWFESACTEETSGAGADKVTKLLQQRKIRFSMVLDEGGMVVEAPLPGTTGNFAMVGVGEKGAADLKFVAGSSGGHASTPGNNTPLVRLGKFMAAADRSHCFTVKMNDVTVEMFRRASEKVENKPLRFLFRNAGRLRGLLCLLLPKISVTAKAMLQTTLAFTMAGGSDSRNALPQEAWVTGNMRFSHHQGGTDSKARIRALAKKFDVEMTELDPGMDSGLTNFRSEGFRRVEAAVNEVFPEAVCAPFVTNAASDCRYFSRVSDCCLRFAPFVISEEQLESIHGVDESVDVAVLSRAVDFYKNIIKGERK